MDNTNNGVIYARYSPGPNQTEQSIEGQVRDCMEYAKKNNINILDVYADRSLSGTESEHRDEFQRMLREAERKQFSRVIVWKIDRFGRNREEIAINKLHLKKQGVKVCYAKEHIPEGPEGIILESMLEGMAEYYSAELSQKIKRGQRESFMKGRILSNTLRFGYKKNVNLQYEIDDTTAPIVREMFQMYADGYQLKNICDKMNNKGVLNTKGKPINSNFLYRMFRCREYIGEYSFSGKISADAIPRIISEELWDAVEKRVEESKAKRTQTANKAKASIEYLLSGKVTCGLCGESYNGTYGTGRDGERHYYYTCRSKRKRGVKCDAKNYKMEWLDNFVIERTVNDVLNDNTIDFIAEKVIDFQKKDSISFSLKSLEKQLKNCEKKIKNLMDAIEAGIITPTTKNRLTELENEKEQLVINIAKESKKRVQFSREQIIYWLELFRDGKITDDKRTKICSMLINHVVIERDQIIIAYNLISSEKTIPLHTIKESVRLHSRQVD